MKLVMMLTTLLIAGQAFAASSTLKCTSETGSVLEWSEKFGELTVTVANGEVTVDQDGLALGQTKYIETMPGMFATPIVYGDETPEQVIAEIQVLDNGSKQIELDGEIFSCQ